MCVLKYIRYISYIRVFPPVFSELKKAKKACIFKGFRLFAHFLKKNFSTPLPPNLHTVTPLLAQSYPPICTPLPPLFLKAFYKSKRVAGACLLPLPLCYSVGLSSGFFFLVAVFLLGFLACSILSAFLASLAVWSG